MKNIILSDCEEWKIKDFKEGLESVTKKKFFIKKKMCIGRRNTINNLYRYLIYIFWPVKIFMNRKEYDIIVGWQQFFAIFLAFFCRLFKVKKTNKIVICNFTYKEKSGIVGKFYKKIINYCINNVYVDFIHVPSDNYARGIAKEFKINLNKFIVTQFGVEDMYNKWKHLRKKQNYGYTLAIGRSNRDYDFLINEWRKIPKKYKLYIISDEYKPKTKLPNNIVILKDVVGDSQYNYIMNCKIMIIPIKDSKICSGDTVLLTAMSFERLVIVTKPSTLEEMYIKNNENGLAIEKKSEIFNKEVLKILANNSEIERIGKAARQSFLNKYSRKSMGEKIGEMLKDENCNDRT